MSEPSLMFDQVVLFGDSITQGSFQLGGTGAALTDLYQRVFDVQNRGLGGYNTSWSIPIAKKIFPKVGEDRPRTALLLVWFGANDAALPISNQHVPLSVFKQNLHTIFSLLASPTSPHYSPTSKLLLITPPPFSSPAWLAQLRKWEKPDVEDRTSENTRLYAEAVKEVGKEAGVPVVDAWSAITKAAAKENDGLDKFLADGLHLTADGYEVVTEEVKNTIAAELPELHWDTLKQQFPHWTDIANGALRLEFAIEQ